MKNLKYLIVFIMCSLFLLSCEQDELIIEEAQNELTEEVLGQPVKMTLSEANKDEGFVQMMGLFKLKDGVEKNTFSRNNSEFNINVNHFYKIQNEDRTSYTFFMDRGDHKKGEIENLIVEKVGDSVSGYILKYINEEGKHNFLEADIYRSNYKKDIEKLLAEAGFADVSALSARSYCTETVYTRRVCGNHGYNNIDNPDCWDYGMSMFIETIKPVACPPIEVGDEDIPISDGGSGGSSGGSGGGTVTLVDCPDEPGPDQDISPDGLCVGEDDNLGLNSAAIDKIKNGLGLSNDEKSWLENNPLEAERIYLYLENNTTFTGSYNSESKDLANEFIDALVEGTDEEQKAAKITIAIIDKDLIEGPYDSAYFAEIDPFIDADLSDEENYLIWQVHFSVQCAILRFENPGWSTIKIYWEATKEMVHIALDLGGMVPLIGEVCDLVNGAIYTLEGDGVNATLSFAAAIPIAGWWATGAKYVKKTLDLAGGFKTTLKWTVKADGLINFGRRSQLRRVLGIPKGNTNRAHHVIPWEFNSNPIVQAAAKFKDAWHPNDLLNAKSVEYFRHSGSHGTYNDWVVKELNKLENLGIHNNPEQAYIKLKEMADYLKSVIDLHPTIKINELPLP